MTPKEQQRDAFKRALLHTTRALSAQHDVEVGFGGEHASVQGKNARIPLPARNINTESAAIARGEGDAAALRLAHHDETAHAALAPIGAEARAVFAALENARCEAIGARALKGVGDNLAAALNKSIADKGYDRLSAKDAAPLGDVAALLLRERLTGRSAPAAADSIMATWRDDIEARAGGSLDAMAEAANLDDQEAFANLARAVIRDLDLDDENRGDQEEQDDSHDDDANEEGAQSAEFFDEGAETAEGDQPEHEAVEE